MIVYRAFRYIMMDFKTFMNQKGWRNLSKQTIGFVGTGVMGKSMAKHLQQAGHPIHIYTRTKQKATDLMNNGAFQHDSVASLANASDVIITMVGYPKDVEDLYFGDKGII